MNYFIDIIDIDQSSSGYLLALAVLLSNKESEFNDIQFSARAGEIIKNIENKTNERIFKYEN
jgi:hypothetical protein